MNGDVVEYLAGAGERWDAIYSIWGALWFADPQPLLPRVHDRLSPGGKLVFSQAPTRQSALTVTRSHYRGVRRPTDVSVPRGGDHREVTSQLAESRPSGDEHDRWNCLARGETPSQRLDRNYGELLQEVRVAQTGVQFLLAFLLTLAFTPRFATVTPFQRDVYVASLVLGAAAAALLIAPAPFHRLVFRRRLKRELVSAASLYTLCGLGFLMVSLATSLLLILDVVVGTGPAVWISGGILVWFVTWWFLVPLWNRLRRGRGGPFGDVEPQRSP